MDNYLYVDGVRQNRVTAEIEAKNLMTNLGAIASDVQNGRLLVLGGGFAWGMGDKRNFELRIYDEATGRDVAPMGITILYYWPPQRDSMDTVIFVREKTV